MSEENQLIVKMLDNFREENTCQHLEINRHLQELNGTVAKMKHSQYVLRYILAGIAATLIILGFMPERFYVLIKSIF